MVAIPRKRDEATVEAVYAALEQAAEDGLRPHLGFSVIGRECLRAVWYGWRWVTNGKHEGRVLRVFRRGKLEEEWLTRDLQGGGIDHGGHFTGEGRAAVEGGGVGHIRPSRDRVAHEPHRRRFSRLSEQALGACEAQAQSDGGGGARG